MSHRFNANDSIVADRFHELQEIGHGRHSRVYRAKDRLLSRWVAIKTIEIGNASATSSIDAELRTLGQLNHPSIIRLLDVIRTATTVHLVQPLCSKGSLRQFNSLKAVSLSDRTQWIASICDSLNHTHQSGFIHGDIKPANILLDSEDNPFLSDFSEAVVRDNHEPDRFEKLAGSTGYIAPELLKEQAGLSVASDIYSLGVTLYEVIALQPAFSGSAEQIMLSTVNNGVPKLDRRSVPFASDWNAIIQKATHFHPHKRYASAAELAADIRALNEFKSISAKNPTQFSRLKLWLHREKQVARRVGIAFAIILAAFSIISLAWVVNSWQLFVIANEEKNLRDRIEEVATAQLTLSAQIRATETATAESLVREAEARKASQLALALKNELQNKIDERTKLSEESKRLSQAAMAENQARTQLENEAKAKKEQLSEEELALRYQENRLKREKKESIYWRSIAATQSAVKSKQWEEARTSLDSTESEFRGLEYYILEGLVATKRSVPLVRPIGDIENVGAFQLLPHDRVSILIDRLDVYRVSRLDHETGKLTPLGDLPQAIYDRESRGIKFNGKELVVFTGEPAKYDRVFYSIFDVSGSGKLKQVGEGIVNGYFLSTYYLPHAGWVALLRDEPSRNEVLLHSLRENRTLWSENFHDRGRAVQVRSMWCEDSVICLAVYMTSGSVFHLLHETTDHKMKATEVLAKSPVPWVFISPNHAHAYCPPPYDAYKNRRDQIERFGFGKLLANRIHYRTEENPLAVIASGLESPVSGAFSIPIGDWTLTKFEYLSNGKALAIGWKMKKPKQERKALLIDFGIEPSDAFKQLMSKVPVERLAELLASISVEYDYSSVTYRGRSSLPRE